MTSPVVHSQCLPINFNIFNDKKYCVAWQLQQYYKSRKYDFILLMLLRIFYIDNVFNQWHHQPVNVAVCFLRHFRISLISNVNFFVLTKHWSPILLSKLSSNYAVLEKWIKMYVNFGVHGPLTILAITYLNHSIFNWIHITKKALQSRYRYHFCYAWTSAQTDTLGEVKFC